MSEENKEPRLFVVQTVFKVEDILKDPAHEAYKDLIEMLAKLKSGELCLS